MKIIQRYVLRGHLSPFFLGLVLFTFVLFLGKLDEIADTMAKTGWPGIRLAAYVPIFSLQYTVPMGILVASLIAFGRLTADNELTALRASGISPLQLIFPCLGVGLILSLFSLQLSDRVVPPARHRFELLLRKVSEFNPELIFKERTHIEEFSDHVIWVDSVKGKHLEGIKIWQFSDRDYPFFLQAPRGTLVEAPEGGKISLKLEDVTWEKRRRDGTKHWGKSVEYELRVEFSEDPGASKHLEEMTFRELRARIDKFLEAGIDVTLIRSQLQERIALSFACLTFVLVGTPMGIRTKKGSRGVALGISFGLIILYYCLLVGARMLAMKTWCSPTLALWLPNILLAGTGTYLLAKVRGVTG